MSVSDPRLRPASPRRLPRSDGPGSPAPGDRGAATDRPRDLGTYSLRGIAVLLMVAGHVIGWDAATGMRVADDSAWRLAYRALEDVRMPLFTVLSGYVYALRPLRAGSPAGRFLRGKARRLLIPLLTVGAAFYVVQSLMPGTNATQPLTGVWRVWFGGYGHFWFVQALFLVFAVLVLLERGGAMRTPVRWALAAAVAALGTASLPLWSGADLVPAWSSGAVWLAPYFLLGLGLCRFPELLARPRALLVAGTIGTVALATSVVVGPTWPPLIEGVVVLGGAVLVLATLVRVRRWWTWRPLAWLGQFSYGVYLLHVFGAAGARIVLGRAGVDAEPVVFLAGLAAGVALPVLVELVLAPHRLPMLLVFGQRPAPRSSYARVWRAG